MEIAAALLVALSIGVAISFWKMLRRNNDPKQQELALMFTMAAMSNARADAAREIGIFIRGEGWDRVQAAPRIAHALSVVKITQPALYENAIEISRHDELWDEIPGALNPRRLS